MTSALKGEMAWMDKGTALIENTMNAAYRLYSQLRTSGGREEADTALSIAKDIHEVKKEYFLIMRGISETLERDAGSPGMELGSSLSSWNRAWPGRPGPPGRISPSPPS